MSSDRVGFIRSQMLRSVPRPSGRQRVVLCCAFCAPGDRRSHWFAQHGPYVRATAGDDTMVDSDEAELAIEGNVRLGRCLQECSDPSLSAVVSMGVIARSARPRRCIVGDVPTVARYRWRRCGRQSLSWSSALSEAVDRDPTSAAVASAIWRWTSDGISTACPSTRQRIRRLR